MFEESIVNCSVPWEALGDRFFTPILCQFSSIAMDRFRLAWRQPLTRWWGQPSVWCKADRWKTKVPFSSGPLLTASFFVVNMKILLHNGRWLALYPVLGTQPNIVLKKNLTATISNWNNVKKHTLRLTSPVFQTLKFMVVVRASHLDILQWQRNWATDTSGQVYQLL